MPYINLKTTSKVTDEKCTELKTAFGKAIESFPGKSEAWLMVDIEDGAKIWFRGDNSADTAVVTVDIFGDVNAAAADKMTAEVCNILNTSLGIAKDRIYIKYTGFHNWGWNGGNF